MKAQRKEYLRVVRITDIPRAEEQITRTIETLLSTQFEQDPLFDTADSFRNSIMNSAVKREGAVIEAAIQDAIDQTNVLRLLPIDRKSPRVVDILFELRGSGWLVALEIKRSSQQDSKAVRQFRRDITDIPSIIKTSLPLFPIENVRFHVVFISGKPPFREGITPDDLSRLYGLHIRSHIQTARQMYSAAIKRVLRERGL
jgi:hypothetical protein